MVAGLSDLSMRPLAVRSRRGIHCIRPTACLGLPGSQPSGREAQATELTRPCPRGDPRTSAITGGPQVTSSGSIMMLYFQANRLSRLAYLRQR
jgi:hypothetical protein